MSRKRQGFLPFRLIPHLFAMGVIGSAVLDKSTQATKGRIPCPPKLMNQRQRRIRRRRSGAYRG